MKILYAQEEEGVAEEEALAVSTKGIHTFMLKSFDLIRQNSGDKKGQTRLHLCLVLLVGDLRFEKFVLKRTPEISRLNPVKGSLGG